MKKWVLPFTLVAVVGGSFLLFRFLFAKDSQASMGDYVLSVGDHFYSQQDFSQRLEGQYKESLKQDLIAQELIEREAKEKKVSVTDKEVIERLRLLVKSSPDYHDANINDPALKKKTQVDMLMEKLLLLENPVPEEGYYNHYLFNSARFSEVEYKLVRIKSTQLNHDKHFIDLWNENGRDFMKTAQKIGITPGELKEVWMKEKDLDETEAKSIANIVENDFVQFHGEQNDMIVWLKEIRQVKIPYEQVKDRVKVDYLMVSTKSMKQEYLQRLREKYHVVINTSYFSDDAPITKGQTQPPAPVKSGNEKKQEDHSNHSGHTQP